MSKYRITISTSVLCFWRTKTKTVFRWRKSQFSVKGICKMRRHEVCVWEGPLLLVGVWGVSPRKFWNFKAWKCNFLQSEDDRSGGSPLENFEISRPENAFSCNLRMGGLRVYPRKFWNFKTWKCNFLQSEVMEVWRPPPENFEISRLENAISCNLRMDFQLWKKRK